MQGIEVFRSSIEWEAGATWHFDGDNPENRAGLLVPKLAEFTEADRFRYATQYAVNTEAVNLYAGDPRLVGISANEPENRGIVNPEALRIWRNIHGYPAVFNGHTLHSRDAIDYGVTRSTIRMLS